VVTARAEPEAKPGKRLPWLALLALGAVGVGSGIIVVEGVFGPDVFVLLLVAVVVAALVAVLLYPSMAVPLVVAALFMNISGNAVNLYGAPPIVSQALPVVLVVPVWYAWFSSGRTLVWTPALWAMLAFILLNLIGVFVSSDTDLAMQQVISLIVEGFALLFLLANAIRTRESLRLALVALVASAALVGAVALFQQVTQTYYTRYLGLGQLSDDSFATGEETLSGEVVQLRLGGMIGEKNYFAQFMLMVIPIGAGLALTESSRARRASLIGGSMLIGVGVVLTFSRGAAVAAAALVATGLVLRLVPLRVVLVVALGAGVLVLAFPQYLTRIATISDVAGLSDSTSTDVPDAALRGRAAENAAALLAFSEHPLFGLGPGQFPPSYQYYARKAGVVDLHATDRRAHNLFLAMLAEVGLIGTALFIAVLVAIAIPLIKIRRRARSPADAIIATGLLLGIAAFLFAGVFLDLAYQRYFWLLVGLAGAAGTVLAPVVPERAAIATPSAGST
jgi:putative inorganic carbon (HCO3(-)) transporter